LVGGIELVNAIDVCSLTKQYRFVLAVDHINFEVNEGEIFGFLGPNGAGKTTTIRILTGLTKPSGGCVKIFGHDIVKETIAAKRHMGIVQEDSNVYNDLSAWDNMNFAGELYHVERHRREKVAKDLLGTMGLERIHERVKGFSKGMKRRLTIAMAMINDPRLLFLDEPTAGLDVQSALLIRKIVRERNASGTTIFLTTHNIEEANVLCDRVAIINKGRIAAIDRPANLKRTIQSSQSIEVTFDRIEGVDMRRLAEIPSVNNASKEGDRYRLYTHDPAIVLEGIWGYAKEHKLRIITMNTMGPSLEDVFLRLTGGESIA